MRNVIVLIALTVVLGPALPAAPQMASAGAATVAPEEKKLSYFDRLWELDKEYRKTKRGVTYHRSNYVLPFTYNFSPNPAPLQEIDPEKTLTKGEVTFQISFKTKLWEDCFGREMDLWFGYTQRSFWQLYNVADSAPFRETNYEPELLFNLRTRFSVLGSKVRFIQFGLNHQSNGQSEPLSRSWNRLIAGVGLERGPLSLLLTGWVRFTDIDDDNPRLTHYLGYGEVRAYYFLKGHRLGVIIRDNLNLRENRGAVQLEWCFPLFAQFCGCVQYFLGYGESLIDYNHRVNRIGVGLILSDWN